MFSLVKCRHCGENWCDTCYKEGFFVRKSLYCIVSFRASNNAYYIDFNKLHNDDFHFACSHFCQVQVAKKLSLMNDCEMTTIITGKTNM